MFTNHELQIVYTKFPDFLVYISKEIIKYNLEYVSNTIDITDM